MQLEPVSGAASEATASASRMTEPEPVAAFGYSQERGTFEMKATPDGGANPTITLSVPVDLPETIIVNGVTYRREAGWIDQQVSQIQAYKEIAERTDLTLRQAVWFHTGRSLDSVLPD